MKRTRGQLKRELKRARAEKRRLQERLIQAQNDGQEWRRRMIVSEARCAT